MSRKINPNYNDISIDYDDDDEDEIVDVDETELAALAEAKRRGIKTGADFLKDAEVEEKAKENFDSSKKKRMHWKVRVRNMPPHLKWVKRLYKVQKKKRRKPVDTRVRIPVSRAVYDEWVRTYKLRGLAGADCRILEFMLRYIMEFYAAEKLPPYHFRPRKKANIYLIRVWKGEELLTVSGPVGLETVLESEDFATDYVRDIADQFGEGEYNYDIIRYDDEEMLLKVFSEMGLTKGEKKI